MFREEGVALPGCLVSAFSIPAFGLTQLMAKTRSWTHGPWYPVHPQQSHPTGWFSHPADLPLSTASATDVVEVLLEMEVNKRLQENAPEREAKREDSKPEGVRRWREEEMQREPDVCQIIIVKTVRSSYILYCLSSELLRASTEKVSYLAAEKTPALVLWCAGF